MARDNKGSPIDEATKGLRNPGETGPVLNLTKMKSHVRDIEAAMETANKGGTDRAREYKAADKNGFNRAALAVVVRLKRMTPEKRADFFRTLDAGEATFELRPEPDMIDQAEASADDDDFKDDGEGVQDTQQGEGARVH